MLDVIATDIALWALLTVAVVAVVGAAALPATRPYVKKYWWVSVAILTGIAGLLLFRKRPSRGDDSGKDIAKKNSTAAEAIVTHAELQVAAAELELRTKLGEADKLTDSFDQKMTVVTSIDDSLERRKALIEVVESSKGEKSGQHPVPKDR